MRLVKRALSQGREDIDIVSRPPTADGSRSGARATSSLPTLLVQSAEKALSGWNHGEQKNGEDCCNSDTLFGLLNDQKKGPRGLYRPWKLTNTTESESRRRLR
jgi:hypothetical protein